MLKKYEITDRKVCECPPENEAPIMVFSSPDENEKRNLIDNYKIDEHTLHSALDKDEQPRLEFEPNHVAVILKSPKNYSGRDHFLFKVLSFGMFLFKDKLVIITDKDVPLFNGKPMPKTACIQDVFFKIILRSISHFFEHLKVINQITDELEHKINASMENKYLLNLFTLEKSLVYYLSAIGSNSAVIERIKSNSAKIGISPDHLEFLEDLLIENNQCLRMAEIYSNVLSGLMDARVSIVGNNLNVLMKTLNIITIGLTVPILIVSVFSMNVDIPLKNHPLAFWIILGMSMFGMMMFMLFWKFKKW
jgi:magnesium transporter